MTPKREEQAPLAASGQPSPSFPAAAPAGSIGVSLNDDSFDDPDESLSQKIAAATPEDPLLGQLIGNCRLEQVIGRGGFGVVYKGKHIFLDETFAIKILHLSQQLDKETVKRFRREALTLLRLRHEKIVHFIDFGFVQGVGLYLSMEHLEGQTLRGRLIRDRPYPLAQIRVLMEQLCEVLQHVHNQGIVHRDLKPGNLFLTAPTHQDGPEVLKLIDFGIASLPYVTRSLTHEGDYLGTAEYSSPEQAKGVLALDGRSDLYAVGAILFRLLVGHVPFRGQAPTHVMYQQVHTPAPTLSQEQPTRLWAPPLEAFVGRALAKDPAQRPQSARLFWEQLQVALDAQEALEAGAAQAAPTLSTQPKSTGQPSSRGLWLVVFVGFTLLSGVGVLWLFPQKEGPAPLDAGTDKAQLQGALSTPPRHLPDGENEGSGDKVGRKQRPKHQPTPDHVRQIPQRAAPISRTSQQPPPRRRKRRRRARRRRRRKHRICGHTRRGHRWLLAKVSPKQPRPTLTFAGCRTCTLRWRRGFLCLMRPTRQLQVSLVAPGHQVCILNVPAKRRHVRWRLRPNSAFPFPKGYCTQ